MKNQSQLILELINVALAALSILAIVYVVWILPGTALERLLANCLGLRY